MLLLEFFPGERNERFFKKYDEGRAYHDLIITIIAVTAKILGPISWWSSEDVDTCLSSLLTATAYDNDAFNPDISLDQFRQECLLAYYHFHQFPGAPAWMRISRLTRKAYAMDLNQIEDPDLCSIYETPVTDNDIEDWRYVWWFVYSLDSYSNMSLGTPFVVDMESINTALVRRSLTDEEVPNSPKLFLPEDLGRLWKTAQDILSSASVRGGSQFSLFIITTTILRQAGNALRLRITKKQVHSKMETLKGHLASLRLALPQNFLNPARNVLTIESGLDQHARLTSILHLHMARSIISLPQNFEGSPSAWLDDWQKNLETCQDIASVAAEWNSQFSSCVDPACCVIAFVALRVINLHRRCITDTDSALLERLTQDENILSLFLEQFASIWGLPRILLQLYRNSLTDDKLTFTEVDQAMNRIKTPLHLKILQRAYPVNFSTAVPDGQLDSSTDLSNMWSLDTQFLNF
ncbi:hypothetical protein M426DRAFT_25859 [Hypoxylon sp. CI-4A]|nr:hypothetical protein M426DRAFT_25859 [Hypoxylon sp. CI-4A]